MQANLELLLGSHLVPRLSDVLFFVEDVLDVRQQLLARSGDLAGLVGGALAAARLLVQANLARPHLRRGEYGNQFNKTSLKRGIIYK